MKIAAEFLLLSKFCPQINGGIEYQPSLLKSVFKIANGEETLCLSPVVKLVSVMTCYTLLIACFQLAHLIVGICNAVFLENIEKGILCSN